MKPTRCHCARSTSTGSGILDSVTNTRPELGTGSNSSFISACCLGHWSLKTGGSVYGLSYTQSIIAEQQRTTDVCPAACLPACTPRGSRGGVVSQVEPCGPRINGCVMRVMGSHVAHWLAVTCPAMLHTRLRLPGRLTLEGHSPFCLLHSSLLGRAAEANGRVVIG